MASRTTVLLSYAKDEEIDAIKAARRDADAAEAERRKLAERAGLLEYQASETAQTIARIASRRRAALVAAALGEKTDGEVPSAPRDDEPSADDLRAAAAELRSREKAKGAESDRLRKHASALESALLEACSARAAADYAECAIRLGELHAAIGGVQPRAARDDWWFEIVVPGSVSVPALRGKGDDVGGLNKRALVGGDLNQTYRRADAALEAARAELRRLVG